MKTFVADDNSDSRQLLADLLQQWGHEVASAEDGQQAWNMLANHDAPRLLILDWVMPRINGVDLCRRLRTQTLQNPPYIILLTSKVQPHDAVTALEAGANDYITKPCNFDELHARIQVGCRMLELQAQLRDQERIRGALQMAGTVCHEMNQPLQVILTSTETLLEGLPPEDPQYEVAVSIQNAVLRLGEITRRIMNITRARTCDYLGHGSQLINLIESSNKS